MCYNFWLLLILIKILNILETKPKMKRIFNFNDDNQNYIENEENEQTYENEEEGEGTILQPRPQSNYQMKAYHEKKLVYSSKKREY